MFLNSIKKEKIKNLLIAWLVVIGVSFISIPAFLYMDSYSTTSSSKSVNLPKMKRMEIFTSLVMAEDCAYTNAQSMYPVADPSEYGYSQAEANEQVLKQAEELNILTNEYRLGVAEQYGISQKQLMEIVAEGVRKNWPMP